MYKRPPRIIFVSDSPALAETVSTILKQRADGLAEGRVLSVPEADADDWQTAIAWADLFISLDQPAATAIKTQAGDKVHRHWSLDKCSREIDTGCIEVLGERVDGLLGGIKMLKR